MGREIAKSHGINLSEQELIEIIKELMGIVGLGVFAQQLAIGLYKFIPYFGAVTTIPTVFSLTYAIGKLLDEYFKQKSSGFYIDEKILKNLFKGALQEGKKEVKKHKKEDMEKEFKNSKAAEPDLYIKIDKAKLDSRDNYHIRSQNIADSKAKRVKRKIIESKYLIPHKVDLIVSTDPYPEAVGKRAEANALYLLKEKVLDKSHNYRLIYSKTYDFKLNNKCYLGEIDLILFDLEKGFIVIEVKNSLTIDSAGKLEYKSGVDLNKLFNQMERNKRALIDFLEDKIPSIKNNLRYETAVFIPDKEKLKGMVSMHDNIMTQENLTKKVEEIFNKRGSKNLNKNIIKKSFEELVGITKGYTDFKLIKNFKKETFKINISELEEDYFNTKLNTLVIGGPGTGKTYHCIRTLRNFVEADSVGNALYLCYNRKLSEDIQGQFKGIENVDIFTVHKFDWSLNPKHVYHVHNNKKERGLVNLESIKEISRKYDLIIIDEAQDFKFNWIELILDKFLTDRGSILLAADETQNIFKKDFVEKYYRRLGEGLDMNQSLKELDTYFLFKNHRNSLGIHQFVEEFCPEMRIIAYSKILTTNFTDIIKVNGNNQVISEILALIKKIGIEKDDDVSTVILSDRIFENFLSEEQVLNLEQLKNSKNIDHYTVQAYKGLEADIVIYIQNNRNITDKDKMINYEAMTRARFGLYVIRIV